MWKKYAALRSFRWMALVATLLNGLGLPGCDRQTGAQPAPRIPEVAVVAGQPQRVELTTELPGRTSAYQIAEIRPQVSGIIQKRLFQEGSDVKAGQVLYQIDPAPFQVALDSARASLGKAQANLPSIRLKLERYKELIADKAVSRQDYDDALAAVEQSKAEIEYWKAQVEAARINLEYTRVTAPFAGRIGRTHVRTGTLVTAYQAQPFATVQRLDPIYVDVAQSAAELLRLRRSLETGQIVSDEGNGRKVRLVLEDGTLYPQEGRLQFRDVTVDPTTGSYTVRIVVPNPKQVLLPGMFVRAIVQEGIVAEAILVPQQGVSRTPKGEPVALVVDAAGTVHQRLLKLDRAIGDQWLVSSGLTAGERLIVEGQLNVRPGALVKAVELGSPRRTAEASEQNRPAAGSN